MHQMSWLFWSTFMFQLLSNCGRAQWNWSADVNSGIHWIGWCWCGPSLTHSVLEMFLTFGNLNHRTTSKSSYFVWIVTNWFICWQIVVVQRLNFGCDFVIMWKACCLVFCDFLPGWMRASNLCYSGWVLRACTKLCPPYIPTSYSA